MTSKYLDVPGSGYGQQHQRQPPARPAAQEVRGVTSAGGARAPEVATASFGSSAGAPPSGSNPAAGGTGAHPFAPAAPPVPPVLASSAPVMMPSGGMPGPYMPPQPAVIMMQHPSGMMVPVLVPSQPPLYGALPQQQPPAPPAAQQAGAEGKPTAGSQQQQRQHRVSALCTLMSTHRPVACLHAARQHHERGASICAPS